MQVGVTLDECVTPVSHNTVPIYCIGIQYHVATGRLVLRMFTM